MENAHQSIEEEVMAAIEGTPDTEQDEGCGFFCLVSNLLEGILWALLG